MNIDELNNRLKELKQINIDKTKEWNRAYGLFTISPKISIKRAEFQQKVLNLENDIQDTTNEINTILSKIQNIKIADRVLHRIGGGGNG